MGEFELIERYFSRPSRRASLGVGDDCALLDVATGHELAVSTDMLVCERHFLADVSPATLGWKCLAVNLSDLAAMGAAPVAFTLALALPAANDDWLRPFSQGLFDCAARYECDLIGGDTTAGPLTISITVFGEVPRGKAITRAGAKAGHDIWVSGALGRASLGLRQRRGALVLADELRREAIQALEEPTPRIALGLALRGVASAMIDVSDGLASDLGHVLSLSQVGASVDVDALPLPSLLAAQPEPLRLSCLLAGGDDYELCFTAPAELRESVRGAAHGAGVSVTRIGIIEAPSGLRFADRSGAAYRFPPEVDLKGFDHFG